MNLEVSGDQEGRFVVSRLFVLNAINVDFVKYSKELLGLISDGFQHKSKDFVLVHDEISAHADPKRPESEAQKHTMVSNILPFKAY